MIRSPSTASLAGATLQANKSLKFVSMIHLSAVKRLVDVIEWEESDIVALVCRPSEDLRERCYILQFLAEAAEDKVRLAITDIKSYDGK